MKLKYIAENALLEKDGIPQETAPSEFVSDNPAKLAPDQVKKLHEMVTEYNKYVETVHGMGNLVEISNKLLELANMGEAYALNEVGDSFDQNIVKKNFVALKKHAVEFKKIAKDVHSKHQQMQAIMDDFGHIMTRYFDQKD